MTLSEDSLKQLMHQSHNVAFKVITGLTIASALAAPTPTMAKENAQTPQDNIVSIDQHQDMGLERPHQILTTGANFSNKAKHLYDWRDFEQKYHLDAEDFAPGAKVSPEKAALLQSIIEYEATRANAVDETLFYNDLVGKLSPSVDIDARVQEAKDNHKNFNFSDIYQKNSDNLKNDKYARKQAEDFCKKFINSNTKNLEITNAVDCKVMDNIEHTPSRTLSSVFFMNYLHSAKTLG